MQTSPGGTNRFDARVLSGAMVCSGDTRERVFSPPFHRLESAHVASNDRTPRRRSSQPPAQADENLYEDDVFYGGDWREDEIYEDDVVDYRGPSPAQGGTAAGINRLRQSLGRGGTSGSADRTAPQPAQPSRRRPAEAPGYEDDARATLQNQQATRPPSGSVARSQPQRQAPRRAVEPVQEYDDYEPYEEYEDDFSEYDAPRPQRAARPRPGVSVPSIKRPTMPSAIANADLVSDVPALALIGTSIVSLVAMAILVGNQASSLAPEFATHVSASGVLEDFRSESALWRLPLLATAFTLMNMVIAWFTSPIDRFASRFVLAAALIVQFMAWVAVIRIL